ncbi:hypothetical protein FRB94_006230 [Tulasnella sp. JGI-2019a]|nr:hypothetical protein FRB94_006230 [Tulasnella sp. JGI-2019a]KAG9024516.1 hypothetical protein FRB95_011427 [Tulasnella sp. JGI-2019a]
MFQLAVAASPPSGLPKQPPRFQHYILIRLIPILTIINSAHIVLTIYVLDEKNMLDSRSWETQGYGNVGIGREISRKGL